MITNVSELKELIIWAKEQKLQTLKLGEVEFTFSNLALIEGLTEIANSDLSVPASSRKLPDLTQAQLSEQEEEELLFHSTR